MTWEIRLSKEVRKWYDKLPTRDRGIATSKFVELAQHGNELRYPQSRSLGRDLFELRFRCQGVDRRVTYTLDPSARAITLTTFRKQRQNERGEVERAKRDLRDLQASQHEHEIGKRKPHRATPDPLDNYSVWKRKP